MQPALAQPCCQDPDEDGSRDLEEEPSPSGEPAEDPAEEPAALENGTADGNDDDEDECDGDATPCMIVSDHEDDGSQDESTYPGSTDAVTGSPPPSLSSPGAPQALNNVENSTKASNAEKKKQKTGIKRRNVFFPGNPLCQLLLILPILKT